MIFPTQNILNWVINLNKFLFQIIENYLANSVQLKQQATYIFNGQVHLEQDIHQKVEEISQIKNITSPIFKFKLQSIFIRKNQITKYKKELAMLYEQKIDKNNKNHIKMLFDIWRRFNKYDQNIKEVDQKWSKYFIFIIYINIFYLYSQNWISR